MEPRAHHVIIGLFTLLAFASALIFALWLSKSSGDRDWAYYEIGFDHAVSGLSKGNPVLYSGVQVGDVLELNLDTQNPSHVRALVRVDREIPIRENTRAGLILANITGSMSIQFSGGTTDSPQLEGNEESPPLIMAEPSAFTNIVNNGESLLAQAEDLLVNANRVFSEDNVENLSALLANARQASDALLAQREDLVALLERFDTAARRAEEAAIKVSRVSDNANDILTNQGQEALDAMTRALGSLQTVTNRIDRITLENEGALASGFQGMGELSPALRELRSTLRNLNQLTRNLQENPSGLIWGGETFKEMSEQ